jgi:hypothetical protein
MATAKTLITSDIKDSVVGNLSLWSSQKIQAEIAAALGIAKAQLENLAEKDSVRVAVSTNISFPLTVADGVTLANSDRLLLFGQTDASENGIYVYHASTQGITRADDANTAAEIKAAFIPIEEGTYADTFFQLLTDDITLDTTPLVFQQFAPSVNLTAYAQKVGNQDIEITDFTKGIILTAPDATRVRVQVEAHPDIANAYILTTTSL